MELDEMKTLWGQMSAELEKQKKLSSSLINSMTKLSYRKRINSILLPELAGSVICVAGLLFTIINFGQLNSWYLQACGAVTVVILIVLPALSLKAVVGLRAVNIMDNNFRQSLVAYAKRKKQFVQVQKLNFLLGAILLLVILPVLGQLVDGKDLFKITRIWLWYCIVFPFFYSFSKWVFKSYLKAAEEAENMLKELEG